MHHGKLASNHSFTRFRPLLLHGHSLRTVPGVTGIAPDAVRLRQSRAQREKDADSSVWA